MSKRVLTLAFPLMLLLVAIVPALAAEPSAGAAPGIEVSALSDGAAVPARPAMTPWIRTADKKEECLKLCIAHYGTCMKGCTYKEGDERYKCESWCYGGRLDCEKRCE